MIRNDYSNHGLLVINLKTAHRQWRCRRQSLRQGRHRRGCWSCLLFLDPRIVL